MRQKSGFKSLYTNSTTKQVIMQEDVTEFSRHVSLKSYKKHTVTEANIC